MPARAGLPIYEITTILYNIRENLKSDKVECIKSRVLNNSGYIAIPNHATEYLPEVYIIKRRESLLIVFYYTPKSNIIKRANEEPPATLKYLRQKFDIDQIEEVFKIENQKIYNITGNSYGFSIKKLLRKYKLKNTMIIQYFVFLRDNQCLVINEVR